MSDLVEHSDAELVVAVLDGDRAAFAEIYDRYADRLHDFCHSVLRDRDEAADAVQDTFVLVAQRLAQLNDPGRLRPWLYAVARSVALRKVRARRRVVLDEVEDMADTDPGPERVAEQVALRDLVWSAAAGLSERDRALLDLHVRQGLDGADLGDAMGVSAGHAYVLLSRLRDQVERSLGALLIARQGRADCTELDALLSGWDGRYSPLMRKRVARHVDSCDVCADRRRIMVSPFALLAAVPLVAAPVWLRDRVLDDVELAAFDGDLGRAEFPDDLTSELLGDDSPTRSEAAPVSAMAAASAPSRTRQRGRIAAAAAAVLALAVITAAVAYWRSDSNEGEPIALDLPAPSESRAIGTATSSNGPSSAASSSSSAAPADDTTTTDAAVPGGVDDPVPGPRPGPGPVGGPTTTTRVVPPEDPPDPPDPPDTTPPVIVSASASPQQVPCKASASINATATDDVGVIGVTATWSGPESGSTKLSRDGDTWFGTLGPFNAEGLYSITVTATDAAGNPGSGSGGDVNVIRCGTVE